MPEARDGKREANGGQMPPLILIVLGFLAILGILFVLWLIVRLEAIVVLILISIVLACGLGPGVAWLERIRLRGDRHIPRGIAILLIFIFAAIIALGAAALIVVPVVQEAVDFSGHAPQYAAAFKGWLTDLHQRFTWIPDYAGLLDRAREQLGGAGKVLLSSIPAAFGFFGGVISVLTVLVLTFYLLSTYEGIRESFMLMIPVNREEHARGVLSRMAGTIGAWLRGQLLLAGIIGFVTALGMLLIGVPYPFVIAVVGAIGELVPMVGPFAAAIPAIIITIASGDITRLAISLVFFILLANVEGNVLAPKIMQRQVGLSPLSTILALITGASLMGIVGALLAIPLAAALRVLFNEVIAPAVRRSTGRDT